MKTRISISNLLMASCAFLLILTGQAFAGSHHSADVKKSHRQADVSSAKKTFWPKSKIAQRAFSVDQFLYDDTRRPWKLWMISVPHDGRREAVEFFSGERVKNIKSEPVPAAAKPSDDQQRDAYTFIDAKGRRYSSTSAIPPNIELDHPSSYAGWEGEDKREHDVVLGAYLFESQGYYDEKHVYMTKQVPISPSVFFKEERSCDELIYVVRTSAPRFSLVEKNFVERTKVMADYDVDHACWNTQPVHVVDLNDNTFLLALKKHVFRINSYDISPAGAAPDLRIIDVKEEKK